MKGTITDDLALDYLKNSFTSEDIDEFQNISAKYGFSLFAHEHKPQFINGPEIWFPQIAVILSHEVMQSIVCGLATNALYDWVKVLLLSIQIKLKANLKNRPFYHVSNGEMKETTPSVHIVIEQNHIDLPVDMDQEKFEYCIDKAMETVKQLNECKKTYCIWDENAKTFKAFSYEESLRMNFSQKESSEK